MTQFDVTSSGATVDITGPEANNLVGPP